MSGALEVINFLLWLLTKKSRYLQKIYPVNNFLT